MMLVAFICIPEKNTLLAQYPMPGTKLYDPRWIWQPVVFVMPFRKEFEISLASSSIFLQGIGTQIMCSGNAS
jgi:hypothetical protein